MSHSHELQRIRATIKTLPPGQGRRLTPELRARIGRYADRRSGEGASQSAIAREVGVSKPAVARAVASLRKALVPVRVVAEPVVALRSQAIVRAPGGLSIEGLDVEGIAALVRALS